MPSLVTKGRAMPDLHPTVEACVARSFCDASFNAAENRHAAVVYLMEHIHGNEHVGPMEGCPRCAVIHGRAFSDATPSTQNDRKDVDG